MSTSLKVIKTGGMLIVATAVAGIVALNVLFTGLSELLAGSDMKW